MLIREIRGKFLEEHHRKKTRCRPKTPAWRARMSARSRRINAPKPRSGRRMISRSAEETQKIGFQIARQLRVPSVVLLCGALGTGKTTLARGIALGMGIEDGSLISSPSFTLVNIYAGRCRVFHVDLYRLESERDIRSTGLDEFLGLNGVTIVEWGERLPAWPDDAVVVDLEDAGGDTRIIEISKCERKIR